MITNVITLSRGFLTFGVIDLFGRYHILDIVFLATIILIFALDAVEGSVARIYNETSKIGNGISRFGLGIFIFFRFHRSYFR